jgi:hypothetical protein
MSKRGVLAALVFAAMVVAWSPTVLAGPADPLQDGDHVVGEELCARPA